MVVIVLHSLLTKGKKPACSGRYPGASTTKPRIEKPGQLPLLSLRVPSEIFRKLQFEIKALFKYYVWPCLPVVRKVFLWAQCLFRNACCEGMGFGIWSVDRLNPKP